MPNQPSKTPDSISQSTNWLADAPGGDFSLDELFPNTEGSLSADGANAGQPMGTPTSQSVQQPTAPQAPVAPSADEFFLQIPTGTVYKSREEAIRGIAEKDTLVETLRQKYIDATHVDPISGRPVVTQPTPPASYMQDSNRLYDDFADAVSREDKTKYGQILKQYVQELIQPYVPIVAESAKVRAQELVSQDQADFREVVKSEAFTKALDSLPGLKQAIQTAEASPEYFNQLPELYRTAYFVTQGLRAAEIARTPVAQPQGTTPTRPTVQPTTLTPPLNAGVRPSLATHEGRQAIIESGNAKGLEQLLFGDLKV